jgi:ribosomal protein S18
MKKIRIIIPMPCDVTLSKGTAQSINELVRNRTDIQFEIFPVYGSTIAANRILGINHPLLMGTCDNYIGSALEYFDGFLCVDNRKMFTTKDFNILLDMDVNIASGWYLLANKYASFFEYDHNEKEIYLENEIVENKIISVGNIGTGFYLIKSCVFKKMLNRTKITDGGEKPAPIVDFYFYPKRSGKFVGEDIGFCDNLKLIDEIIYVNKNVFVKRESLPFLRRKNMNIEMKKIDILNFYNVIKKIYEDEEIKIPFNFSYKLSLNLKETNNFVDAIEETKSIILKEFNEKVNMLREELKTKVDKKEILEGEVVSIFNNDVQKISVDYKNDIETLNKFLSETETINIYKYKINGNELDAIPKDMVYFITDMIEE